MDQPSQQFAAVVQTADAACQQHELVAPQTRHRVRAAHVVHQTVRHHPQQFVTHGVAVPVVDRLETVQVEETHQQPVSVALACRDRRIKPRHQGLAIGKPGERVAASLRLGRDRRHQQRPLALLHLVLQVAHQRTEHS